MQVTETYIFMHVRTIWMRQSSRNKLRISWILFIKKQPNGGLISGEHGIGYGKMDYLAAFAGETSMRLMKGIKEVFDPKMILNPGKVCYFRCMEQTAEAV